MRPLGTTTAPSGGDEKTIFIQLVEKHPVQQQDENRRSQDRLIRNCNICWNYLYLSHQLEEAPDAEASEALLSMTAAQAPKDWAKVNMRREYYFSEDKLKDALGVPPEISRIELCSSRETESDMIPLQDG